MITTTTLHTIQTTELQLKKNLYFAYAELLQDSIKDDVEYFENDAHRLSGLVEDINKKGFRDLFRDGFTMMLLDPKDFDFVDQWFNEGKDETEKLEVVITNDKGDVEILSDEDLSY